MAVTDTDEFWASHRPLTAADVMIREKYRAGLRQFLWALPTREMERRGPPDPDSPQGMYLAIEAERAA